MLSLEYSHEVQLTLTLVEHVTSLRMSHAQHAEALMKGFGLRRFVQGLQPLPGLRDWVASSCAFDDRQPVPTDLCAAPAAGSALIIL